MRFCENCFIDPEIKSTLSSLGIKEKSRGKCPICNKNHVYIYDTDKAHDITINSYLEDLISVYKVESELPKNFPSSEIRKLSEDIKTNWRIFNPIISNDNIENIIRETVIKDGDVLEKYLSEKVGLFVLYDNEYVKKFSILKNGDWDQFVEELKFVNRFHSNYINIDNLQNLCKLVTRVEPKGKEFYRCRIINNNKKLSCKKMGAPPQGISLDGRANSFGISRLYLASDKYTAIGEVRSGAFDNVCVGKFVIDEDIYVVDLDILNEVSPFTAADISLYATNIKILNKINYEVSKVISANDNRIDYIPAQFITDTIQAMKDSDGNPLYDGIKYTSTMKPGTYNLAIFNVDKAHCKRVYHYQIKEVFYETKRSSL